jgi:hypothetical protein
MGIATEKIVPFSNSLPSAIRPSLAAGGIASDGRSSAGGHATKMTLVGSACQGSDRRFRPESDRNGIVCPASFGKESASTRGGKQGYPPVPVAKSSRKFRIGPVSALFTEGNI